MINDLMTIEEICSHLGIGKNSAYKLAKTMRSVKIGRKLMVPKADVDHYVLSLIKQREERMKEREKNFQKMRE
jgi:excisionase family DNA binding protein